MGVTLQDRTVHERPRIALVAVADHIFGEYVIAGGGAPFAPGGKSRTAPSPEAGGFDLRDDLAGRHAQRLFQRLVTAPGDVIVETVGTDHAHVAQGDLQLRRVEGILLLAPDFFSVAAGEQQPVHGLAPTDGLFQNFRHVGLLHAIVGDIVRQNGHQRPVFTAAHTAGTVNVTLHRHIRSAGQLFKSLGDPCAAVGEAAGAAAHPYGLHPVAASSR